MQILLISISQKVMHLSQTTVAHKKEPGLAVPALWNKHPDRVARPFFKPAAGEVSP